MNLIAVDRGITIFRELVYFTYKYHIVRAIDVQYMEWVYSLVTPKDRIELINDMNFTARFPEEIKEVVDFRNVHVWRFARQ